MSHQIPAEAQRLIDRMRVMAAEIESAARVGVPIPFMVSVSGAEYGEVTFPATPDEFTSWADYLEGAQIDEYELDGRSWRSVSRYDLDGVPVSFATIVSEQVSR